MSYRISIEQCQQKICFGSHFFLLIRKLGEDQGYPEVDHIELFGSPSQPGAHSRNFVLCPGKAYDRSPCGTGTSAKLACLAAAGKLAPGERWVQESLIGSTFAGHYEWADRDTGKIHPTITGRAFITAPRTAGIKSAFASPRNGRLFGRSKIEWRGF